MVGRIFTAHCWNSVGRMWISTKTANAENPKSIKNSCAILILGSQIDTYVQAVTNDKLKAQSRVVKNASPRYPEADALVSGRFRTRGEMVGSYEFFKMLASQSIPSWNQIIVWLREMETLRKAAA
jgi:hypothetical protein